ncbi:MAG: DUF1826 domain-containing protein [Alphaproteobacteria bacterium]|nr:DUF1826 domain-containing protein [Alphaproteobacteria bacterium]
MRLPACCAVVPDFESLVRTPFRGAVNALCWERRLDGDFGEIARRLAPPDGLAEIEPEALGDLALSPAGARAAAHLLADLERLDALGLEPVLNVIASYPRDTRGLPIATDVHSFHVDRAPVEVDTWVCTYHGASTEGLAPDAARRRIDDPGVRDALHAALGEVDLSEESFDLHYRPEPGARPFSFGLGSLWRVAVAWPGAAVPPCVHRAPPPAPGDAPRLLLVC